MSKSKLLRGIIQSESLSFLMEAHSGLSARIVEEAGFEGIWASGLSIAASLGLRDCNEASWTQVVEIAEFMSDSTRIPILLDGDTGYGNFNTVRRLVRKLEQRGIAGVCIEDKLFPKTNSFIRGKAQELAGIDEFCGKIRAGKDSQHSDDFVIVARVEVLAFKREWGNRLPVVIVPTKYFKTPTQVLREAGFSVAIWANHLMRASLSAMQQTASTIFEQESLVSVEGRVTPLEEVFRLQDEPELAEAERRYLPARPIAVSATEPLRQPCPSARNAQEGGRTESGFGPSGLPS